MASPYTPQSPTGYNSNPPSDDGAATVANQVKWATVKTKIGDPLNTFASDVNSALVTAFGKTLGANGVGTTAISYSVLSTDQGKLIKATASGVTITTPDATDVQSPFVFSVLNNSSGSITLDGFSSQTVDGATSISIPAGAGVNVETNGSNWFTHGQNYIGTQVTPQGRLTLTSATPILTGDVSAATAVYYTPYSGNLVPIYNGTLFQMRSFAELTLTLQSNSNYAANAIYDVFIFDSSGTVTVGIGPAWSTATAGSCARGTGAGTTELERKNGLWTNKVEITARNAGSTYTVAANQATYVGSLHMDGSNGQISCLLAVGQARKIGIWNAYNRVPVTLAVVDTTATWTGTGASTWRIARADTSNFIAVFSGLAEETYTFGASVYITGSVTSVGWGIGWNSTSAPSGQHGFSASVVVNLHGHYEHLPALGLNNANVIEFSGSAVTFNGTEANMRFTAAWRY